MKKGYYLENSDENSFTNEEILAISKIILESRAFNKKEVKQLLKKLVNQSSVNDKKVVEEIIRSEEFNYIPLQHRKNLLSIIWNLSQHIAKKELIYINYTTKNNENRKYNAKPLSIMFLEYYFYLIAYIENKEEYPAVLRIDRISEIKNKKKKYSIPYKATFKDGEFRKYVQFMHSGKLTKIRFEYNGYIEYVLDRFPIAEVKKGKNGTHIVEIEVYGSFGAEMWIRSQGEYISSYEIMK